MAFIEKSRDRDAAGPDLRSRPAPHCRACGGGRHHQVMGWVRQVIGLCLTAFLQSTILIAGLKVFKDHALMGVGLMLSAGEVPRIAGSFGLDTTTKANITSAVYTAQSAVNVTRTIAAAIK